MIVNKIVIMTRPYSPKKPMAKLVAYTEATIFTKLLPISIVLIIFSFFANIFSIVIALLFP